MVWVIYENGDSYLKRDAPDSAEARVEVAPGSGRMRLSGSAVVSKGGGCFYSLCTYDSTTLLQGHCATTSEGRAIVERYILEHGDALEALAQAAFGALGSIYGALARALVERDDALTYAERRLDDIQADLLEHGVEL